MCKSFFKIVVLISLITLAGACGATATPVPAPAAFTETPLPTNVPIPTPTPTSLPPTAEDLVDECAKAMGGIEKIDALETMRFSQRFPDHAGLVRYEIKRPNRVRMGDQLVFDGERASWLAGRNADGTQREAELVPEEDWKDFEVDIAWYVPAFFDYPAEYLGTEVVDQVETHKLQVRLPLGATMTYYLDTQTHLVYKASAHFTIGGQEFHPERTYSDYRLCDGILYPHAFTYEGRDGVFTATMVTLGFNIPLEDERFSIPADAALPTSTNTPALAVISIETADRLERLHTLRGHSDKVYAVAFSGDGVYVASASMDRAIKLWDVRSGQEVATFPMNEENGIAFSPDGRLLASAHALWDVESRQMVHTLEQGSPIPGPVAFSPDGSVLAVALANQAIKLWDVASGQVLRTFDRQADNLARSIAFSPDGTLLAAGGNNGTVRLWDVAGGHIAATLEHGNESHIHGVVFSPDGSVLASASTDYTVRLWDVASGQVLHTLRHRGGLYEVAFSPDGTIVAAAGAINGVQLWHAQNGGALRTLLHDDEMMAVAFSPDGALLVAGGYDHQVYMYGILENQ